MENPANHKNNCQKMKLFPINFEIYSDLLFLLDNYRDNEMPPTDYIKLIQDQLVTQEEHKKSIVEMFLSLAQHRQLLSDFIDYFYCIGKRKDHSDKHHLMILTYVLIKILNDTNKDSVIDVCQRQKNQQVVNFFRFLNKDLTKEMLLMVGSKYFEESYLQENILADFQENTELLEYQANLDSGTADLSALQHFMKDIALPPAKPVPESMYKEPKINDKLIKLKDEHRTASKMLLEEANESTRHLSVNTSNKKHTCPAHGVIGESYRRPYKSYKAATIQIPVKKNAATLLREAARLIKEEEKDIQRINEIVCGTADHTSYEVMVDQLRAQEEQLKLQDVERKHLLGQLSREEAILARQRILEINKARRAQIEKEKRETEEIVKKMQQKREEETKKVIEEIQQIQSNIEEKRQNIIHKKNLEAQEVVSTSKQLYAEAIMQQKEEMEKRMEIIKEIKALSSIKDLHSNKFDPTETMNIGLLCEMSMAELYERLFLKRRIIKEEIENRQKCIRKQKHKQQQFLADTQQFIDDCREQKKLLSGVRVSKLKQHQIVSSENKDILELRERLEKARLKRLQLSKN